MRALVIGASGQIGGHLLAQLQAAGHFAVGTCATVAAPGLVPLRLEDPAALAAAVADTEADLVVLCAGWTWVDANEDDPARAEALNRDAPLALAAACRARGALLVHYSTDYLFDGEAGPYPEEAPPSPVNVYGRTKLAAEEGLLRGGAEVLILRTTTVYGPEAQGKNFVYQLLRRLGRGEPFRVPADQLATPSYGPDVAAATLALVEQGARGVWNVAGPDLLDRGGFARLACEVFGVSDAGLEALPTAALGQKARRPLRGGLLTGKLRAAGIEVRGARAGLEAMRAELAAGRGAPL